MFEYYFAANPQLNNKCVDTNIYNTRFRFIKMQMNEYTDIFVQKRLAFRFEQQDFV